MNNLYIISLCLTGDSQIRDYAWNNDGDLAFQIKQSSYKVSITRDWSDGTRYIDCLQNMVHFIKSNEDQVKHVISSNGAARIYSSVFLREIPQFGFDLSPDLLLYLGELRISFSIDYWHTCEVIPVPPRVK